MKNNDNAQPAEMAHIDEIIKDSSVLKKILQLRIGTPSKNRTVSTEECFSIFPVVEKHNMLEKISLCLGRIVSNKNTLYLINTDLISSVIEDTIDTNSKLDKIKYRDADIFKKPPIIELDREKDLYLEEVQIHIDLNEFLKEGKYQFLKLKLYGSKNQNIIIMGDFNIPNIPDKLSKYNFSGILEDKENMYSSLSAAEESVKNSIALKVHYAYEIKISELNKEKNKTIESVMNTLKIKKGDL